MFALLCELSPLLASNNCWQMHVKGGFPTLPMHACSSKALCTCSARLQNNHQACACSIIHIVLFGSLGLLAVVQHCALDFPIKTIYLVSAVHALAAAELDAVTFGLQLKSR